MAEQIIETPVIWNKLSRSLWRRRDNADSVISKTSKFPYKDCPLYAQYLVSVIST